MNLPKIIVPVAAFAVTATAASAFSGTDWISKTDLALTDTQVSALEEAHTVRQDSREKAKQILEDAGIDQALMKEIREARHEVMQSERAAIKAALEAEDYDAFVAAIADTPMAEKDISESDFAKLVEAHALRKAGDHEGARTIMEELGLTGPDKGNGFGGPGHREGGRQSAES